MKKRKIITTVALLAAGVAQAVEIDLDVDAGYSSVAAFGSTLEGTVNDPFAYDPKDPTVSASGAVITWGPATDTTDKSQLIDGPAVFAMDGSPASGSTSIDGVSFIQSDYTDIDFSAAKIPGVGGAVDISNGAASTGDAGFDQMLKSVTDSKNAIRSGTQTLKGLVAGEKYKIQVFYNDQRALAATRSMTYGDGEASESSVTLNARGTGWGQFAVGTLTADGSTQRLTHQANNMATVHVNAICVSGTPDSRRAYLYAPVEGGIEIVNGERRFNRPLYSSVERPYRLVALAGDRPDFMLMKLNGHMGMTKLANLKLGCADDAWFSEVTPVHTRYVLGQQRYRLGEMGNGIQVDAIRAISFDGLLLRIKRGENDAGPLVIALGGRARGTYNNPNRKNNDAEAFNPEECEGTKVEFSDNAVQLSGKGPVLYATANVPLSFTEADAHQVAKGPSALCASKAGDAPVAAIVAKWPASGEIYLIFTPDHPETPGVKSYVNHSEKTFNDVIEENRSLAHAIEIDTPDPYLNTALPHALLAYNAAWNAPSFRHGAIGWHNSFAGWRVTYGATTAGWHDRVQAHMSAFYKKQHADGLIPSLLERDSIHKMGEVLVDQALYDWEWTGDLEPMRDGGFEAIARHLAWGERHLKTPEGLYENFLNAWNTDYKWCNGGGGTIASAYYWRANKAMADIAARLRKNPSVFKKRTDEIADAMKKHLWSERVGVYGEYRDRFGHQLLHESPDLSSIYTPIYLGFCDPFESYRMLNFALRRFGVIDGLPRGGKLIYSSEILPNHYSTRGLYPNEIIDALFAMYRIGQSEVAEPFRRAIDGTFFSGPGPGSTGLGLQPDGKCAQLTDFTGPLSLYVRNVVEGLFGVHMQAPEQRMTLHPAFPLDWNHASIRCPAVEYDYQWDGRVETMSIKTQHALSPTIRLRMRQADICAVKVKGIPFPYEIEAGIDYSWVKISLPQCTETEIKVGYGTEELPMINAPRAGREGESCVLSVNHGNIKRVRHGQQEIAQSVISKDGTSCTVQLPLKEGVTTYFVLVVCQDSAQWLPLEIAVQKNPAPTKLDITNLHATSIDLSALRNQRLEELHDNTFGPLIDEFYWVDRAGLRTVKPNGRSWWEGHGHDVTESADTALLEAAAGRFISDNGIPFVVPASGNDAVFTSLYTNFPDQIEIPVNLRGRKICFLIAASISTAQSRMENARITIILGDGTERTLSLRDPETIDDWLGSGTGASYVQSGRVQRLGQRTHAVLQEIDLGEEKEIQSVILETRTNETMVGLLGMTVMQEEE